MGYEGFGSGKKDLPNYPAGRRDLARMGNHAPEEERVFATIFGSLSQSL
jgi:hypothetical protein